MGTGFQHEIFALLQQALPDFLASRVTTVCQGRLVSLVKKETGVLLAILASKVSVNVIACT